ncbi:M81 family metallopeptidase [Pseudoroseomonas cervicalis]|uniref:M81 family metallopeptidase n=1 Tax=Teichococcus cervicalis TaxID=204525 RepID=UPI00278B1728|nr:M81 family metallopeptidase [Pseudoroseomonas cervicalis]MDQ1079231.1 microcystin degradation protein MlrC [Pseudoroseomonas cervicalis]
MRIALGGFLHESHSFAPRSTGWEEFRSPGGFPGFQRGAGLLDTLRPTSVPSAGAIERAAELGATLVPLAWSFANPAGPVTEQAFERISACIIADLADALDAGKLDGVYLDLHGAMVAEGFPDAEGELLRRVRAVVGPDIPVTASLDPHCNLTLRMVEMADALVPFRTYPHVDMKAAGAQAMQLLADRIARGTPFARAFRQAEYWMPLTTQCTMVEPMQGVMATRAELARRPGVAELGFCFGFPYADFADCGVALACYAQDQAAADQAADALLAVLAEREPLFAGSALPAAEGVAKAKQIAASATKPIVLADTQDNPGGGGHGDTTGLLAELVRQQADATLGLINDAESAAACHAAGEGAELELKLGGKSDGVPFEARVKVLRLTDGRFTCTGPMSAGNPADLGPSALIAIGPVKIIIVSRKMQAHDQALFRHIGIEPARENILALKSSVHFRADFQPIAEQVLVVAAPGPVLADPSSLPFQHLRPGLRTRPRAA